MVAQFEACKSETKADVAAMGSEFGKESGDWLAAARGADRVEVRASLRWVVGELAGLIGTSTVGIVGQIVSRHGASCPRA